MSALMVLNVVCVMAGAAFLGWAWRHRREVGFGENNQKQAREEASK